MSRARNFFQKAVVLKSILLLAACGSNSSDDSDGSRSSLPVSSSSASQQASSVISSPQSSSLSSSSISVSSNNSSVVNSSMSSSSLAENSAAIEFVFPPQGSHLGGQTSTPVSLKVVETDPSGTVEGVTLNGEAMTAGANGVWELASLTVDGSSNQRFDVTVSVGGNALEANAFEVNNEGGPNVSKAGNTRIFAATGLAVKDDGTLYFSNAYDGLLYEYNSVTAESTVIYQETIPSVQLVEELYWPIAVEGDSIYLFEDSYSYDDTVGSGEYDVNLVVIDDTNTPTSVSYPGIDDFGDQAVFSARGIFVDFTSEIPLSGFNSTMRFPTLYSLDHSGKTQPILKRWFLDGSNTIALPATLAAADSESELKKSLGVLAFDGYLDGDDSKFIVIREYETENLTGSPALIEITSRASTSGTTATSTKVLTLNNVNKPTAVLYSSDGSHIYIADTDRIWRLNLVNYQSELISSTNNAPMKKGFGPRLGGKISAMSMHPTMNYLYITTGASVMMVNLDNGNRVTLIK